MLKPGNFKCARSLLSSLDQQIVCLYLFDPHSDGCRHSVWLLDLHIKMFIWVQALVT